MVAISWRWARLVEEILGTRRLQPQMRLLVATAIAAGAIPLILAPGLGFGGSGSGTADLGIRRALVRRHGLRRGGRAPGQVPPSRCSRPAGRNRVGHLRDLRLVIGAGSCGDPACRRDCYNRPHPARPALAAQAIEGLDRAERRSIRDCATSATCRWPSWQALGMTAISYAVMTRTPPDSIADFFIKKAYSEGGGRNVVNVILVDFRGFDTLGEITVLGIVALTVFALLRRFRPAPDSIERPEQQRIQRSYDEAEPDREAGATAAEYLYVPSVIMQWMFPVVIVLSAYLFLRGHDAPGGGFVAGVAMAAGFILQYMAAGTVWVEDRLRILPVVWIGGGLLLAALTGAVSMLLGDPFLTSYFQYVELPILVEGPTGERDHLRPWRLQSRRRRHSADADCHCPPVDPPPARRAPDGERQLEERQQWN